MSASVAAEHPVRRLLVLQHVGCEPPAAYEDELVARGFPFECVRLDLGARLPDWRDVAGIVAMGGPMGARDDAEHPWLVAERALIRAAVRAGVPYWGVCLGAQLLAASLGARVFAGPAPEVGVSPVRLTAAAQDDPVMGAAPAQFPVLHWHGDTYELPPGAVHLARSAAYEQQAFAIGRAYALQFHLEVTPQLAATWADVPAYATSLERAAGRADALPQLVSELARVAEETTTLGRSLFGCWLDRVVEPWLRGVTRSCL